MPAGDGTGPRGMGPGTGRGMCESAETPDPTSAHPGPGRGHGMRHGQSQGSGRGWGRGRGHGGGRGRCYRGGHSESVACDSIPHAGEATCAQELEMLREQAEHLKKAREEICERIKELEKPEGAQKE